jgi:dTDP-4-dehydrorhamnose 3,5-epimerase
MIEEPFLVEHITHEDHRGIFCASPIPGYHQWYQVNTSTSREKFTVRGLHFQTYPFAQRKYLKVISGKVFNMIINIDVESILFGKTYVFEIDRNHAVMVPPGHANGLITLEENTVIQYFVDNPYSAESEKSILYSSVEDFQNVVSSLTDKVVISEKDANTIAWEKYKQEEYLSLIVKLDEETGLYGTGFVM